MVPCEARTAGSSSHRLAGQRWAWGLLLAIICSPQGGCTRQLAVPDETAILERVKEIEKRVASIRGLKFVQTVPVVVEEQNVIDKHFQLELLKEYGGDKSANLSLAYTKLGLFPESFDLKKSLVNFYRARVFGFYAPHKNTVMLRKRSATRALADYPRRFTQARSEEMVLVHELTHVLQNQYFSPMGELGQSRNKDRSLAFRAILEGDATLTEIAYRFGGLVQWPLKSFGQAAALDPRNSPVISSHIPAAILDRAAFPYEAGASLVHRVYREHGWRGVNLLYSSPPLSTEQVLHPEKYLDAPDPPTRVELTNLSSLYPGGWTRIEDNTLGELMVRCLFKRYLSQADAESVASGWDGDRFVAFRRSGDISFIWATAWDGAADAERFAKNYRRILARKHRPGRSSEFPMYYIAVHNRMVVVIEGLEQAYITDRIGTVWASMVLTEETFKSPFPNRKVPQLIAKSPS